MFPKRQFTDREIGITFMFLCERYANHRGGLLRGRNCAEAGDSSHVMDLPLVGQPI
jgi:hypothetical protein